ncbi:huntingtin-interacting protein 1 isoform X1 [Vespula maculifrons]|uniref:Huntingtin-interacting protein 1 isoform X1 n=1 Tax=Vespula maculifrons TaxID=7453 RepID=A0ABD2CB82_VESMC
MQNLKSRDGKLINNYLVYQSITHVVLVKASERTNKKYSTKTHLNSDWFEYNFSMASLSLRVLQQRKNNLDLERKNIEKFQIMCTIVATLDAPIYSILGERQVNK